MILESGAKMICNSIMLVVLVVVLVSFILGWLFPYKRGE
jgi:hypothetical protein